MYICKVKNLKMEDIKKTEVGVIIGRFQLPSLHDGHINVLDTVTESHSNVVVFLGVPRIQNTKRNPLDFSTRRKLIQETYPDVIVMALPDNRSDEKWSENVDNVLSTLFPEQSAILYGSRDSFLPHYSGKHKTQELDQIGSHNASEIRQDVANKVLDSDEFRAGVIYGISKQRPVTYPTVDIVVSNYDGQILLARKPAEDKFRFVGGFVDRTDDCYETAARRELYEETKLSGLKPVYICSQQIKDWRYAREESGIMTTLFLFHEWDQMGRPEASDDIAEVKYFDLSELFTYTQEPSLGDGHVPPIKYNWTLEDKIVPEHIELMQTFLKKVVTDKLIGLK
jgi:bifunctional NMN adenylyltransferase/nudix hydrolase